MSWNVCAKPTALSGKGVASASAVQRALGHPGQPMIRGVFVERQRNESGPVDGPADGW